MHLQLLTSRWLYNHRVSQDLFKYLKKKKITEINVEPIQSQLKDLLFRMNSSKTVNVKTVCYTIKCRLEQRFSNWGPLDGARGAAKKF